MNVIMGVREGRWRMECKKRNNDMRDKAAA
jgi:hypothetical protein